MEKSVEALVERTRVAEKMVDFLQKKSSEQSRKRKLDSPWESVSEKMWEVDRLRESLDKREQDLEGRERNFFMFEERRKRELACEEEDMSSKRARLFGEVRAREEELDLRVVAMNERAERLETAEAGVRDTRRRASERLKRIEAERESLRLDRESLSEKEKKVDVIIEALDGRISAVEKKEEEFDLLQERKTREIKLKAKNLDKKWEEFAEQIKLADEKFKEHRFMERIELAENKLDGVRAKMDERFEVIACRDNAYWESLALSVKEADLIWESVEKKLEELGKMEMEFNSFQEEKNCELASKEKQLEMMGEELVNNVKLRNEQLIEREESVHRLLERLELANDLVEGLRRSVNQRFEQVGLKLREMASQEKLLEARCKEVFRDAKSRNKELKEREKLGCKLLKRLMSAKDTVEELNTKVHEKHKEINMRKTELDSLNDWVEKKMDEADLKAREVEERKQRIAEEEASLILKETKLQEKEAHMISKETELDEKEARLISKETELQEKEARLIYKETELDEKEARLISKETELQEKEARLISKENELQEKEAHLISKETELQEKEAHLISKENELQEKEAHLISKETELQEKEKCFWLRQNELEDKQKEVEERFKELKKKETELDLLSDWIEKKMDDADLKQREFVEREPIIAEKEAHLISKETEIKECEAHLTSKQTELQEKEKYLWVWQKEVEDKQREVDSARELNEQKLKQLDSREKNLNSVREFIRNCFKEHQSIKRKLLTEKDLVEKKANDLVLREQHLNLALEDIELREKQIKDAVKLLELKELLHSTNVINGPLEIEPDECADLKFTVRMDGKTLQMFLNDAEKDFELMGDEIFKVLHLSSDPAKLVLDAMVGFYPPRLRKEDVEFNVRRTCIALLGQLIRMSPKIKTNVREEAIEVATSWKSSMRGSGENGRSMEVLGFLFLLSAFDLVSYFEEDEISSFMMMVVDQLRGLHCVLNSAKSS